MELFRKPTGGRFGVLQFGGNVLCFKEIPEECTVNDVKILLFVEKNGQFVGKADSVGETGAVGKDEVGHENSARRREAACIRGMVQEASGKDGKTFNLEGASIVRLSRQAWNNLKLQSGAVLLVFSLCLR